jgi:xylose isomerase
LQCGSEVSGERVEVGFGVGEGEVKLRAHWIEEHAAAEQFKHHGSATFAVGKASFKTLETYMLKKGEADKNESGRQEFLENLINEFI